MTRNDGQTPDLLSTLRALREELGAHAPALRSGVESEIEDRGGDYYILHFRCGDRACVIEASGAGLLYAAFLWRDRPLFASQFEDRKALADLLKRWISDRAMPSEMRREFPWLEIDKLADYFERGVPLEGEFIRSWDAIEEFYREDTGRYFESARAFIRALREAGYDRLLRAGQSMSIFGLSRSRDQGLREDQPRLWFEFNAVEMDVDANFATGWFKHHPIQLTPDIGRLLDTLVKYPIE